MALDWNWQLGSGNSSSNNNSAGSPSTSGLDILAQLLGNGGGNQNYSGTYDNTDPTGGGMGNQGSGSTYDGSRLGGGNQPAGTLPDGQQVGADIWQGGNNFNNGEPNPGLYNQFYNWNANYNATGFAPDLSPGNTPSVRSGGGGGGGGASGANGQKVVFDARSKTWSLYDPKTKKWQDGIGQNNIYAMLTGTLHDENPEWWWGQTADSAVQGRLAEVNSQTSQYGQQQAGGRQQYRYPTFGLW